MNAQRIAGALIGAVFGVMICWSGMSSPEVIRKALLFESSYLFLFMGSAMFTATAGVHLLRRLRARAVLTGTPVAWVQERPERRHVVGSLIFGLGWGVSGACPGPVITQIGQGIPWAICTLVGVVGGVAYFLRRERRETEPPVDLEPALAAATQPAPVPA